MFLDVHVCMHVFMYVIEKVFHDVHVGMHVFMYVHATFACKLHATRYGVSSKRSHACMYACMCLCMCLCMGIHEYVNGDSGKTAFSYSNSYAVNDEVESAGD